MKPFVLAAAFLGCTVVGWALANRLRRRLALLEAMMELTVLLAETVEALGLTLGQALEHFCASHPGQDGIALFCGTVIENLKQHNDFTVAWQFSMEAADRNGTLGPLTREDWPLLERLGQRMTAFSSGELAQGLGLSRQEVTDACLKARAETQVKVKLYRSLGILTGLGLVILLI